MSSKTAIYDDEMAEYYDMSIDLDEYHTTSCYIFKQKVKEGKEDDVVVDEMITWFNDKTYEVVARTYTISYSAMVFIVEIAGGLLFGYFHTATITVSYLFCFAEQRCLNVSVLIIHADIIDGTVVEYTEIAEGFVEGTVVFNAVYKSRNI